MEEIFKDYDKNLRPNYGGKQNESKSAFTIPNQTILITIETKTLTKNIDNTRKGQEGPGRTKKDHEGPGRTRNVGA